jgi:hypothetical protein
MNFKQGEDTAVHRDSQADPVQTAEPCVNPPTEQRRPESDRVGSLFGCDISIDRR